MKARYAAAGRGVDVVVDDQCDVIESAVAAARAHGSGDRRLAEGTALGSADGLHRVGSLDGEIIVEDGMAPGSR